MMRGLRVIFLLVFLSGCSSISNLCQGFTATVEPARARYFAAHRIYPLESSLQELAEKYKPRLVLHPQGAAPIDFADYFADVDLVNTQGARQSNPPLAELTHSGFSAQCSLYLEPAHKEVSSSSPYPWYVQVFRDKAPGNIDEEWIYLKYNVVFDWSGLSLDMGWAARTGAFLLGASPDKWHRLDVHTAVIIGVDERGYQRLVTVNQHNYVRTYLGGVDYDMGEPITIAAALRSNELYLDQGREQPSEFPVVRFYDSVPYLMSGENKPRWTAKDIVVGVAAGGREVEMRLEIIFPEHPLASFAGLLAPPKRLWRSIYIGRDGPMGYDYYSLPSAVPLHRLAALGYWQQGDVETARRLDVLMESVDSFNDEKGWDAIIDFMAVRLESDLRRLIFY